MNPTFFTTPKAFRKWLEKNHDKKTELWVGYYKLSSGKKSMSWTESVDVALCFGWIDSVRRSVDEESYCNRFTPRKSTSIWSAINIKKVEELKKAGLMTPAGEKAYSYKKESKSNMYSHENPLVLDAKFEKQFKKDKAAWTFFIEQAPSYKKFTIHWIMSAKQEKTRISRLEKTIKLSGEGKRVL